MPITSQKQKQKLSPSWIQHAPLISRGEVHIPLPARKYDEGLPAVLSLVDENQYFR